MGNQKSQIYQKKDNEYIDEAMFYGDILTEISGGISQVPHSLIGAITFNVKRLGNKGVIDTIIGRGSGILISKDIVLTAAHNLFDTKTRLTNSNFKFYLGVSGPLERYYQVEDYFFPGKYNYQPSVANDYALLKLKREAPINNFIPLSGDISRITNNIPLSIFGYPAESYYFDQVTKIQSARQRGLSTTGRVQDINRDKAEMKHKISTKEGQSGAPVLAKDSQGNFTIVAIHTSAVTKDGVAICNSSRLMTDELIKTIRVETQRMGGSQPVGLNQQLQQQQRINQLVQQNQQLKNTNQALSSRLSKMEKQMMPQKSLRKFEEMEQVLKREIKRYKDEVERLTLELQRIRGDNKPYPKPMQAQTRKATVEGYGYDETAAQLSKVAVRKEITHLSITDTVTKARFRTQLTIYAVYFMGYSDVADHLCSTQLTIYAVYFMGYSDVADHLCSTYQPDNPARTLVSIKGTLSATQTYFPVYSAMGGTSSCIQPKFADELSHFTALQSLTFSFKHQLVNMKCFSYLAGKINGLKNLQSVELRMPKYLQQYEQKENWARELKVKLIITYY